MSEPTVTVVCHRCGGTITLPADYDARTFQHAAKAHACPSKESHE